MSALRYGIHLLVFKLISRSFIQYGFENLKINSISLSMYYSVYYINTGLLS